MRWWSVLLPLLASSSRSFAAPAPVEEDGTAAEEVATDDSNYTTFNGVKVPPMVELTADNYVETISSGYWMVKTFSPYCGHCKLLEPKWQTLYELYSTSFPIEKSRVAFPEYYDFHWATLDCIAFGSACEALGVRQFPTLILFKDGVEIKKHVGDRSMQVLSTYIEENLQTIKPGSRPRDGLVLPAVGASDDGGLNKGIPLSSAPRPTPNPDGKSYNFTRETFEQKVVKSTDPWWIKFYAPWCHHCQAMAPSWDAMAREMQGTLNIGDVDCTKDRQFCRDQRVEAYPSIVLYHGPERIDYQGLRGMGDLVSYAHHAVEAFGGVPEVDSDGYEALVKKHDVVFVYFYDHATTSEDFLALERLPAQVIGNAKMVKSSDRALAKRFKVYTWPRLMVSRNEMTSVYDGLSPQHMRDVPRMADWMRQNWLPLLPELTSQNANDIMNNKFVVLGILNRDRKDEFNVARRELTNAAIEWMEKQQKAFDVERQELRDAKQLRIDEAEDRDDERALRDAKGIRINMAEIHRKEVNFAWVDGVFWERWLRTTFGISAGDSERVVINDQENRRYWDQTITGNPITPSRTAILDTLPKVVANPPRLPSKGVGSGAVRAVYSSIRFFSHHRYLAGCSLLGSFLAAIVVWRLVRRRSLGLRSGFFRVGDEAKQSSGFLGTVTGQPNGNGKAD